MNRHFRTMQCALTLLAITLVGAGTSTTALAQTKEVITFAAVTFSEAGRGDRLKAWVDKFNKSQDAIEVQPVALPFASFAKTIFTQMGGGAGPTSYASIRSTSMPRSRRTACCNFDESSRTATTNSLRRTDT